MFSLPNRSQDLVRESDQTSLAQCIAGCPIDPAIRVEVHFEGSTGHLRECAACQLSCSSLRQRLDDVNDLVTLVAASPGKVDKLTGLAQNGTLLRGSGNGHAAAATEFQDALVPKKPQRPEHGVGMDTQDCGHVLRGRKALADAHIAVCDVAAYLGGDLIVEWEARIASRLDTSHSDRQSITIMLEGSTAPKTKASPPTPPEAVIREARRRQWRRWTNAAIVVVVLATVVTIVVAVIGSPAPPSPASGTKTRPLVRQIPPGGVTKSTEPVQPGPLAVGPDGTLYVADEARNQILASLPSGRFGLPSGRFRVVAGNGRVGFSGDGKAAADAELNGPQGMAVGASGTIYIADRGNDRIRAIAPDGTITTVAGNGQLRTPGAPIMTGVPAVQVPIGQVTAITIGPQGSAFFTSEDAVLSIEPDGTLATIDDGAAFDAADPGVMFYQECYPASLAFDASANSLYIGCSSPWVLFVRTADGTLQDLGKLRPHDAWAAITPAPGGGVFAVAGATVVTYGSGPTIGRRAYGYLDYRLPGGGFFWPQGIAATGNGLYLDADGISAIGPAAIVTGGPPGPVTVLWKQSQHGGSTR